jgi:hypothetical protein
MDETTARVRHAMATHVDRGVVPGVVTLVSRGGEVRVETLGATAFYRGAPMRRDTIFRVSSVTKPIVAAAAMTLVDDPVDPLLPELADRRVLRRPDGPLDDTVPARRPVTVRALLTLRLAIGTVFDGSPIATAAGGLRSFCHRRRRRGSRPTRGCGGSARCRSSASPATRGCTRRVPTCWACSWRERPNSRWRRS